MSDSGPSSSPMEGHGKKPVQTTESNGRREQLAKRARRSDPDLTSRNKRMFGLLNTTLTKAREDHARTSSGEAGRKRAELEARMEEKRKTQDQQIQQSKTLSEQLRPLLRRLYALAVDLEADDAAIRVRKAQKRRLASFLITQSDLSTYDGEQAERHSVDGQILAPDIALTLEPIGPRHPEALKRPDSHPIYFLPRQMLEEQDERLDEQEDRVDESIERVDEAWETERKRRQEEMRRVREEVMAIKRQMAALEGG